MVTVSLVTPGVFAAVPPPPPLLPVPPALASPASAPPAGGGPVTVQRGRCGLLMLPSLLDPYGVRVRRLPGARSESTVPDGPADLVGEPAEGALDAGRGDQHHHDQHRAVERER